MPIFTSQDLQRFWVQGENDISSQHPFLVDRYSLATVVGQSLYTIPDYAFSIRRVTYLGWKCDPLPHRNFREVFQSAPQTGRSFWYVYDNMPSSSGGNTFQLFPSPGAALSRVSDQFLWSSDPTNGQQTGMVVEFYRIADNNLFVLPPWAKRQLLKSYVALRSYSIDGPGYNPKLVKYYTDKWNQVVVLFGQTLNYLYLTPRKFSMGEFAQSGAYPGEPVLPIDQFGISVDDGY